MPRSRQAPVVPAPVLSGFGLVCPAPAESGGAGGSARATGVAPPGHHGETASPVPAPVTTVTVSVDGS